MKKLLIISGLFASLFSWSQQTATFSNFLLNKSYFNAAVAGSNTLSVANLGYRNQWMGFEGAPTTIYGNIEGSFKQNGKNGYGLSIVSDRIGLMQNTGFYLNYAQHFQINEELKLGIGVRPGFVQYRIKLYDVQMADQGDEILTGSILGANAFDIQSGVHLYSDRYFVMIGLNQFVGEAIGFTSYNQNLKGHYNIIGGYKFSYEKWKNLLFEPALMIQGTRPVPHQMSLYLKTTYKDKFFGGLSWRSSDALGIIAGMNLSERIAIGYAYDITYSNLNNYSSGSHEISLRFVTGKEKKHIDDEDEELNNSIMDELKEQLKNKNKNKE